MINSPILMFASCFNPMPRPLAFSYFCKQHLKLLLTTHSAYLLPKRRDKVRKLIFFSYLSHFVSLPWPPPPGRSWQFRCHPACLISVWAHASGPTPLLQACIWHPINLNTRRGMTASVSGLCLYFSEITFCKYYGFSSCCCQPSYPVFLLLFLVLP